MRLLPGAASQASPGSNAGRFEDMSWSSAAVRSARFRSPSALRKTCDSLNIAERTEGHLNLKCADLHVDASTFHHSRRDGERLCVTPVRR